MFGLGFWEIFIIFIVLIIFLDPKEIPILLRKIGRFYGEIAALNKDVNKMFKDIESEVNETITLDDEEKSIKKNNKDEKRKLKSK